MMTQPGLYNVRGNLWMRFWTLILVSILISLTALAQQQKRELNVKEMRSGSALDGRGKLWAVVIGVSKYRNLTANNQLEFAHRDAEAFAAFLRSPNGGGYPSSQLTLLVNQAATLSAIRSSLGTTLPRSVEADDIVVIFFAGHGIVEGEHDGYLLAYDSDPQNLYATALQVSELNRIITERLKARTVILIADACHSGQLGWTSRSTAENALLVNRYLDEVGKSGKGVFRLLASRADQRSYEDRRWGGGHGAFTWFLLEGLKGKADRDRDNFVRAGELLDYISQVVPQVTKSLQHPRAAGDIDAQLPMAVLANAPVKVEENVSIQSKLVSLDVRGTPGFEVYIDNIFRGRILNTGVLAIDKLKAGEHNLTTISPNRESVNQKLYLKNEKTILDLRGVPVARSSPLVAQIKQALSSNDVRGAFDLYQQLVKQSPREPQRASIEATLSGIFESIGQHAINSYVQSSGMEIKPGMFHNAAEAYRHLKLINPNPDQGVEAKYLFCEGRAKIEEGDYQSAADRFKQATELDPRSAYNYNGLGVAYRNLKSDDRAIDAFRRAAELAPSWALPQLHIGQIYFESGNLDKAEQAFQNAARFDSRYPAARQMLIRVYLQQGRIKEAEQEATAVLSQFPNEGYVHLWLGQIYEKTKRWALAANAYDKALALIKDLTLTQREDIEKRAAKCRKKGK